MAQDESRYAHLLAPIRDLAANWNTDIASELSDYLQALEEVTFSFDGSGQSLNFAEGARGGRRGAAGQRTLSCAPALALARSRAAHPGLRLRVLAQGGVPAQAGVPRPRGCGGQEARHGVVFVFACRSPPAAGAPPPTRTLPPARPARVTTRRRTTSPRSSRWTTRRCLARGGGHGRAPAPRSPAPAPRGRRLHRPRRVRRRARGGGARGARPGAVAAERGRGRGRRSPVQGEHPAPPLSPHPRHP